MFSDGENNTEWIAADLIAQAEHGSGAQPILVTDSEEEVEEVTEDIQNELSNLSLENMDKATTELVDNGYAVIYNDIDEGIKVVNQIAPEHLEIMAENPEEILEDVQNAGTVFLGKHSAEVLGDYTTGTNHVLPTGQAPRYTGGLSTRDYVKTISFEKMDESSYDETSDAAAELAEL